MDANPTSPQDLTPRAPFAALFEEAAPVLHAWAHVRTRSAAAAHVDADDVVQEVWLRALEIQRDFDPERGSFRAWVLGVAKHVLFELVRRRTDSLRPAEPSSLTRTGFAEGLPDPMTSVRTRLARDETLRHFLELTETLATEDRGLLLLCGFEGLPCAEAARRLGLGNEAAAKRWQRLRERLRHEAHVERLLAED